MTSAVLVFSCRHASESSSAGGASANDSALAKPASSSAPIASHKSVVDVTPLYPVRLTVAERVGEGALVRASGGDVNWAKDCRVHGTCPKVDALKPCAANLNPLDAARPMELVGHEHERVAVRGPLSALRAFASSAKNCGASQCCNTARSHVTVGPITLRDVPCGGDDSAVCCPLPAFGQTATAVGVLAFDTDDRTWSMTETEVCE